MDEDDVAETLARPSPGEIDALAERLASLIAEDDAPHAELRAIRAAVDGGALTGVLVAEDLSHWIGAAPGLLHHARVHRSTERVVFRLIAAVQRAAERLLASNALPEAWALRAEATWALAQACAMRPVPDAAIAAWDEASAAFRQAGDGVQSAAVLLDAGTMLAETGQLPDALTFLRQACDRYEALSRSGHAGLEEVRAVALMNLANALSEQGQIDDAIALHREVHERYCAIPESDAPRCLRDLAGSLANLGVALRKRGRIPEAEQAYLKAREHLAALEADGGADVARDLARVHLNLGSVVAEQGRLRDAEAFLRDAVRRLETLAAPGDRDVTASLGRALLNLGTLLRQQGKFVDAADSLAKGRQLLVALADAGSPAASQVLASTLATLGSVLADQGRATEAEPVFVDALVRFSALAGGGSVQAAANVARTQKNLAGLLIERGRVDEALPMLEEARARFSALVAGGWRELAADLVRVLGSQGDARSSLRDDRIAEASYKEATRLSGALADGGVANDRLLAGRAWGNLGAFLWSRDRIDEAERALREAHRWFASIDADAGKAGSALRQTLTWLAIIDVQRGDYSAAQRLFEQALDTPADPDSVADDWNLHVNYASLLRWRGRTSVGEAERRAALFAAAAQIDRAQTAVERLVGRTRVLADRTRQRDRLNDVHRLAALIAAERGDPPAAFAHAQRAKGRTLADLLETNATALIPPDDVLAGLDAREWELLARASHLRRTQDDERQSLPAVTAELAATRAERRTHLAGRARTDPEGAFLAVGATRSIGELAGMLAPGEALLDVLDIPRENAIALFAIVSGEDERALVHHAVLERDAIAAALDWWDGEREDALAHPEFVSRFPFALGDETAGPVRGLWGQIAAPLLPVLAERGVIRLIVSPSGLAHRIPWAALWGRDRHDTVGWLGERLTLSLTPAPTSLWIQRRRAPSPAGHSPNVFAAAPFAPGPEDGTPPSGGKRRDGFGLLPGTKWEVERIAALAAAAWPAVRPVCLLGSDATHNEVVSALPLATVATLASHGSHDERSGFDIALHFRPHVSEPQLLRVSELYGDGLDLKSVRVLALTACGLGKVARQGDELLGFTQGFLHAGVGAVLAPLWAVDDGSTARLNVEFHRALFANPRITIAEAWQRATRKIRETPSWEHPAFWAAFLPTGNAHVPLREAAETG